MREPRLNHAISASVGVTELVRKRGASPSAVSSQHEIPPEHVVAVETVTGIDRAAPYSDRYGQNMSIDIDEVDVARAQQYALLATLLARAPDAKLLGDLAQLRGDASPLGVAHAGLAEAAANADRDTVEREFFNLFIGLGRGELMPYGSYYLTGFVYERPLARLRGDLAELGIERAENNFEPEDHAATLCEVMSALISGKFPSPPGSDRKIFESHLAPWLGRLFADLETAEAARFYRQVGTVGRIFMQIESEAFALPT